MPTKLIRSKPWAIITQSAKRHRGRAQVAVAYFGQGAARLCPLKKGSVLVVDASPRTVRQGATHPKDLLKLKNKGVRIFTVGNLHAKVFVFGKRAFIGSANVSSPSATRLIEAVVQSSKPEIVQSARAFVESLCLKELGPEALKMLQKEYRPPQFAAAKIDNGSVAARGPLKAQVPTLRLVQLERGTWPPESETVREEGEIVARARRKHRGTHFVEVFSWDSETFRQGESLVQVTDEGDGRILVSPPGNVLHTRKWSNGRKKLTYVYVEVPRRRRISIKRLARRLGRGALTRLQRHGKVRQDFAQRVHAAWR